MGTVLALLYRHLECFPVLGVLLGDENVDVRDRGSRLELAKLRQEYEQEITVRRVRICGPNKKCVRVLRSRRRIHRTVVPGMGGTNELPEMLSILATLKHRQQQRGDQGQIQRTENLERKIDAIIQHFKIKIPDDLDIDQAPGAMSMKRY